MAEVPSDKIKTEVIAGVILMALGGIGGLVWAFVPATWKWFTGLLALAWAHLTSSATVPTWWLYALYAVGVAMLLLIAALIREALTDKGPMFTDYSEDRFFGAVWRWRYAQGGPTGTCAFCPSCDTVLVYSHIWDIPRPKDQAVLRDMPPRHCH